MEDNGIKQTNMAHIDLRKESTSLNNCCSRVMI